MRPRLRWPAWRRATAPVTLAAAADAWIRPIAERALRAGIGSSVGRAAASAAAAAPRRANRAGLAGQQRAGARFRAEPRLVPRSGQRLRRAGLRRGGRDGGHGADLGRSVGARGSRWAWPISPACWLCSASTMARSVAGDRRVPSLPSCAAGRRRRPARWHGCSAQSRQLRCDWPEPPVERRWPGLAEAARAARRPRRPRMDCATPR